MEILNSRTNLQISDMERIICNEYTKGLTANAKKYNVELTTVGPNLIRIINIIFELINPNYAEAKKIVDSAPIVIMEWVDEELANSLKAKFEAEGAEITLISNR